MKLSYRHTLVSLVGGLLAWAQVAFVPDGHIDRAEYYGLAVVIATALGVYGSVTTGQRDAEVPVDALVDAPVADAYPEPVGVPDPAPVAVVDPAPAGVPDPAVVGAVVDPAVVGGGV